jgi:hypothetical protein
MVGGLKILQGNIDRGNIIYRWMTGFQNPLGLLAIGNQDFVKPDLYAFGARFHFGRAGIVPNGFLTRKRINTLGRKHKEKDGDEIQTAKLPRRD